MAELKFSVSEITTLALSFDDDLALYREAGAEGIGIFAGKLPDGEDEESLRKSRESGLKATTCIPGIFSFLPLVKFPGPEDPTDRLEELCTGIRRLAPFEPITCLCLTGPQGSLGEEEARSIVVDGLRTAARVAADAGVTLGLEPIHSSMRDDWSITTDIPSAVELIDAAGEPNLELIFDTWHLWDTPTLYEDIRNHAHRFAGTMHIDDWRDPTRGWNDRALPGEGIMDLPAMLGALEAAGWEGWVDLEIFSDDGSLEEEYPDSLWKLEPLELLRRGKAGTEAAWEARKVPG